MAPTAAMALNTVVSRAMADAPLEVLVALLTAEDALLRTEERGAVADEAWLLALADRLD